MVPWGSDGLGTSLRGGFGAIADHGRPGSRWSWGPWAEGWGAFMAAPASVGTAAPWSADGLSSPAWIADPRATVGRPLRAWALRSAIAAPGQNALGKGRELSPWAPAVPQRRRRRCHPSPCPEAASRCPHRRILSNSAESSSMAALFNMTLGLLSWAVAGGMDSVTGLKAGSTEHSSDDQNAGEPLTSTMAGGRLRSRLPRRGAVSELLLCCRCRWGEMFAFRLRRFTRSLLARDDSGPWGQVRLPNPAIQQNLRKTCEWRSLGDGA